MSNQKPSRGGGWNFRAIVCVAALALSVPASGKLLGSAPGYVRADSSAFATTLLDLNRGDWSQEGRKRFVANTPTPEIADPTTASNTQNMGDPVEATKGGSTICPKVYTLCPQAKTVCEDTKCPAITTQCPQGFTTCPKITTQCPRELTVCPTKTTACPVVATTCEATVCPKTETQCPVEATVCETTKCPKATTLCPVVATKCQWTVCPKTTVCGGAVKTICYGTSADPTVCVEPPDGLGAVHDSGGGSAKALLAKANSAVVARPMVVTFVPRAN